LGKGLLKPSDLRKEKQRVVEENGRFYINFSPEISENIDIQPLKLYYTNYQRREKEWGLVLFAINIRGK
jgi:hypothetical protein